MAYQVSLVALNLLELLAHNLETHFLTGVFLPKYTAPKLRSMFLFQFKMDVADDLAQR